MRHEKLLLSVLPLSAVGRIRDDNVPFSQPMVLAVLLQDDIAGRDAGEIPIDFDPRARWLRVNMGGHSF